MAYLENGADEAGAMAVALAGGGILPRRRGNRTAAGFILAQSPDAGLFLRVHGPELEF